jgi:hypothetical protein
MNAPAHHTFSPGLDETPPGRAEDEADDFVSTLLPYMGVSVVVAIVVITALIAAAAYLLRF